MPRWIKFSGTLVDVNGAPHTGVAGVTFAIYSQSTGGSALWMETQNVTLDANGKYSVLLGAGAVDGLPVDLFNSGDARWLGVQAQFPGEGELPRVLLVSVPYAMKAGDAQTLNGLPASAYALANASSTNNPPPSDPSVQISNGGSPSGTLNFVPKFDTSATITDSQIYDDGTSVGIGTSSPASGFKLHVNGRIKASNVIYNDDFNIFTFIDTEHNCGIGLAPGYTVTGNFTVGIDQGIDGFRGLTDHPCGNAVEGVAQSTFGEAFGVYGQTYSNVGSGVVGESNDTTGTGVSYGVQGWLDGPKGVAVLGIQNDGGAFPPALAGDVIGIEGLVNNVNSIAGVFDNTSGGSVLSGRQNGVETFNVTGTGNVNATGTITAGSFSGSGAGLTGISAGSLSGTANIDITGNAATATTATTATTAVNFSGNLSGDVSGTQGATVLSNSGVTAGTYTKLTVDAKGRATTGATAQFSDLGGSVALGQLPATVAVTNANNNFSASQTVTGTLTATNLAGNGSAVTSLNGTNISSGTVADARLSTNVPLLNAPNIFAPTANTTGVIVKQTLINVPTVDVFAIQDKTGTANFFKVDKTGTVSWTGTAAGSISGNAATATTATSATSATNAINFTGSLAGDVTGTQGATALASVVTAGTNTKITYDAKGRVTAGATAQFSDLGGSVALGQLPATVAVTNANNNFSASQTVTGTVTATNLAGNGSAVTGLDASNVSAGTLGDARLSSNIARMNGANAFAPTTDVTGVAVKQTTASSPASDIFAVQDKTASTNFLKVDNNGVVSWTGVASGSISGNAATATTATSATSATNATNFTGSLAGDVTGTQGATVISSLPGNRITGTVANATNATNATTAVNFTGSLAGDVTGTQGATALASVVTAGTNTKITYDAKGRVTAGATAQFSDLGGSVALGQLPATVAVTNANNNFSASQTVTGTVTATNLAGAGAAITSLNGSNISSGTVADARLSSNVALLNANNAFSPTTDVTAVNVKQTSAASPASDIFNVQNNNASSTFFKVNNTGLVSWTGTATGSISGNAATATTATSATTATTATNATNFTGSLVGDVTGTQGATVLANSGVAAGTYTKITVDAKGRATTGATAQFSDLGGSVALGQLPATVAVTNANNNFSASQTVTGTVTATNLAGAGSAITTLNASNVSSGTLNDARLSANVALLNANNSFAPTADVTGVAVKQTTAASPASDIFAVQDKTATTNFFKVNNAGLVSWTGTATGSISGNAGTATTATSATTATTATNATNFTGSLAGDVSGTQGATVLANSGVAAGTYTKITVDAKGRATTGATAQFSDLGGSVAVGQLPATVAVTNANNNFSASQTITGTVTATNLAGAGSAITSLNASNVSSGTLNDARLSANVALLSGTTPFTAKQTMPSAVVGAASITIPVQTATPTTLVAGDIWNSGTTLKFRDNAATTHTIDDLDSAQTLTNKTISGASNTITNISTGSLTGTVTNAQLANSSVTVTAGTGLSGGGAVALGGSTTLNLANTAVAAGTYTKLTVDAQGRATNGTSALFSDLSGSVAAAQMPALTGDVTMTAGTTTTALANIPTATPAAGSIVHTNIAAPASPAAGKVATYSDSTDLRFHDKNAAGTVGTTVVADTGAANNFLTGISAAGVITKSQPTFANLSGNLTAGQLSGANLAVTNANNNFSASQTVTGTMAAATFSGSGASLTNLPAASLTGTVPSAQMPALTGDVTMSAGTTTTVLANIPTATPAAGSILHANIAAPAAPAAGKVATYSDSTDLRFHDKNAAGTIGTTIVSKSCNGSGLLQVVNSDGTVTCSGVIVSAPNPGVTYTTITTNPTDLNLVEATIPAGMLNLAAKTIDIVVAGGYHATTSRTLTFTVKLCTVSGCGSGTVIPLTTWTTGGTGNQGTNNPWKIRTSISTVATGASGTLEPNGDLIILLNGATTSTTYQDTSLAVTSAIDLTGQLFLDVSVHASGASTAAQLRQFILQPIN